MIRKGQKVERSKIKTKRTEVRKCNKTYDKSDERSAYQTAREFKAKVCQ